MVISPRQVGGRLALRSGLECNAGRGGLGHRTHHVCVAVASWVSLGQKLASQRQFTDHLKSPRWDRMDACGGLGAFELKA